MTDRGLRPVAATFDVSNRLRERSWGQVMRVSVKYLALAAALGLSSNVVAQELAEPLSVPTSGKHPRVHRTKIVGAKKRAVVPLAARLPIEGSTEEARPHSLASKPSATDPVSFGMKWNGTNESGRETRFDNLNGTSSGVGGEVGVKLPF